MLNAPVQTLVMLALAISLLLACPKQESTNTLPETLTLGPMAQGISAKPFVPPAGSSPTDVLLPLGRWVRLGALVGYTYVDPEMGLSIQGSMPTKDLIANPPTGMTGSSQMIVRVSWRTPEMSVLSDTERVELGLPDVPDWLQFYGEQQPTNTLYGAWRFDPRMAGQFFGPDYPDDVKVLFSDAGSSREAEIMWVTIHSCTPERCTGVLLNAPFKLKSIQLGDKVAFTVPSKPGAVLVALPHE